MADLNQQQVPASILKKIKRIDIDTRKIVNNIFSGEYHTKFKGQGMTFADFREYVPGDDVRSISWTLMARAGKPFVKTFEEERELTMIIAVDISASNDFGSQSQFKGETLAYVAATLAFSAIKNNDQVGLLLFTDQVELFVPPKKGRAHVYRILRDILFHKPQHKKTNLSSAFEYLRGVLKKRATVFVLSDFQDEGYEDDLKILENKHEVIAGVVCDQAEFLFPDVGLIDLHDAETGETVLVDTSSVEFKKYMNSHFKNDFENFQKKLKKSGVESFNFYANDQFHHSLMAFFKRRKAK